MLTIKILDNGKLRLAANENGVIRVRTKEDLEVFPKKMLGDLYQDLTGSDKVPDDAAQALMTLARVIDAEVQKRLTEPQEQALNVPMRRVATPRSQCGWRRMVAAMNGEMTTDEIVQASGLKRITVQTYLAHMRKGRAIFADAPRIDKIKREGKTRWFVVEESAAA